MNLDYEKEIILNKIGRDNYLKMKECEHESPYHLEGSVLNHTALVLNEALKTPEDKKLIDAAIFHDIGKPYVKIINYNRTLFNGHDYMSALIYLNYKKDLETLHMILYHMQHGIDLSKIKYSDRIKELQRIDFIGRISNKELIKKEVKIKAVKNLNPKDGYECIHMFGIPGSGKSTFIEKNYDDYFIISRDEVIEQIKEKYNFESYIDAYDSINRNKELKEELNKNFQRVIKEAKEKRKVVIDMTMVTRKSRRSMTASLNKHSHECKMILAPFNDIIKRNEKRIGKNISEKTLIKMVRNSSIPVYQEGYDNIDIIIN